MKLSKISFFICAVLIFCSGSLFYPRWEKSQGKAQLSWDGYYWYLPSVFIYNDIKGQGFKDRLLQKYQPIPPNDFQYGFKVIGSNHYVIRYTMGTALLEAPFFLLAHVIAKFSGYPADGFSPPYQFMIYLGGIFFSLLGLWHLRKLLLFYYSDVTVFFTLLILVFGTNYLNYAGIDVGMTHTWLFTLYVFLLLNTHYYYQTFERKYILRSGLLIGMLTLVRPPEIISILIPLLWGLNTLRFHAMKERTILFYKQWKSFVMSMAICASVIALQFLYWKYATGKWYVYTYRDQGFSWLHPHVKLYALNYQSGWLTYTPVMLFALIGLLVFIVRGKNKVAIICLILVNYYIVSAWDAWDYGGRAMIQNYPLLLFPLAALLDLLTRKKFLFILTAPLLLLCSYFNLWWTYQAHAGNLTNSFPGTKAYYKATIFRYNVPLEIQKLRDNEDLFLAKIKTPTTLYTNSFDETFADGNLTILQDKQEHLYFMCRGNKYKWLRAAADIHIDRKENNVYLMTQFIVRLKMGKVIIQENRIRLQRFLDQGETKNISLDIKVPTVAYDNIEILFRNENNGALPCYIDNITVIGFNE